MSFRGILSAAILVFSEGFILRGPISPLVAQPGGVLQLPCSVETPLPLDELEVEWRRADSKELVHLFQEGQSRPESQSDAYRDRAHFFRTREIAEGNYSILLRNVTSDDVGIYSCGVYRKEETDEIAVEIEIALGVDRSRPCCHMLVLLFQDNETYPGDSSYQGRTEFFTSEIPKGDFSLRLKDVRTEDKGEYICKAFSGLLSANTTVILQELGLSSMHRWVFALCCFAFIVALVSAMILLCIKDISQRAFIMHYVLVFGPSVLMFTAFVLWGVIEGFMTEVVTCSALNLSRFILLFKTSPYQERLPGMIKTIIKTSFEFEYIIVLSILYYVIYNVWSAEVNNKGMAYIGGVYGLSSLLMGVMIFLKGRASILMGLFIDIVDYLYFSILSFLSRTISLSAGISMLAGICVVCIFQFIFFIKEFRFLWKSALIQLGLLALRRVIISVVVFYCVSTSFLVRKEERAGLLSVTVLLHLLALSEGLDCIQPSLAKTPKTILYMYGAFGVLGVNAITLATELILKSRKGYRTVTDLRVILLPFECVFVLIWIALWFHAHWTERCIRIKEEVAIFRRYGCRRWLKFLKNGAKRSEALEMLSQSAPPPAGSDTPQESPQEAPPEAETEIHSIGNVPEDIDTNSPGLVGKNDSHFPDTNPERAEEDCKVGANADTNRHTTGSHINAHLCETITSENDSLLDHTQSVVQINLTKPRDSSAQESLPLLGKDIVESVPPSESE